MKKWISSRTPLTSSLKCDTPKIEPRTAVKRSLILLSSLLIRLSAVWLLAVFAALYYTPSSHHRADASYPRNRPALSIDSMESPTLWPQNSPSVSEPSGKAARLSHAKWPLTIFAASLLFSLVLYRLERQKERAATC